jgi:hypothetical protein
MGMKLSIVEMVPVAEIFSPSDAETRDVLDWCMERFDTVVFEGGKCTVYLIEEKT